MDIPDLGSFILFTSAFRAFRSPRVNYLNSLLQVTTFIHQSISYWSSCGIVLPCWKMWASRGRLVPSRRRRLLLGRTPAAARGMVIPWRSSPRNQRSLVHRIPLAHVPVVMGRTTSAHVRSSDHVHWTIGIDGLMKIKFVSISSAVTIGSAPVHQSRDVKGVLRSITHFYMVLLPPVKRRAVTMGGRNHSRVARPRWHRARVRYQRFC